LAASEWMYEEGQTRTHGETEDQGFCNWILSINENENVLNWLN
jgi:hypothetical protein